MTKAPDRNLSQLVDVASLKPYGANARTHSDEQIEQIKEAFRKFGFVGPLAYDDKGLAAGHGRQRALTEMWAAGETIMGPGKREPLPEGMAPGIDITGLTDDERRAFILADNRIALNAGWDEELLRQELEALTAVGFDIPSMGFDDGDLARLFPPGNQGSTDPDEAPPPPENPVSILGDVWIMGDHRLMCGSSTDPDDVAKAIADRTIDIACSDPPYGISVVKGAHIGGAKAFGKVHGRGKAGFGKVHGRARNAIIEPGTYAPIIGDDTTETAVAHYHLLASINVPVIVLWGGNYFANDLPPSRCWLVWDKENTGTFADAELAWTNQDKVVKLLRHQWSGLIKASERGERRVHPTQKPVALAEWVCATLAPNGKVILDGFVGSGWTIIAAERIGVACVGLELSPAYVDVAVHRWQNYTNAEATLESTGQTFAEVEAERSPA